MSPSGNWSADALTDAAEKCIANMDDAQLGAAFLQRVESMPPAERSALTEAIFDAFRDRGEASEDAAEGAGTTVDALEHGESTALHSLLAYAQANPGVLKEAASLLVEREPASIEQFPESLISAISARLRETAG
jgi:hypothetical protein